MVPVVAKMLLGMETTPAIIFSSTSFWRIRISMPLAAVMKPVGTTTAALPPGLEAGDDVLDEQQVDRHLVLRLVRHLGNAGEEALVVLASLSRSSRKSEKSILNGGLETM